jgi:hypothetical protein
MDVSRTGSRRVVVSVSPRMLGDALSVALRAQDLEVEFRPAQPPEQDTHGEHRFDLAVTSGDLPPGVAADVVVVIPGGPEDCTVRILRPSAPEERRDLPTLDEVLRLVTGLLNGQR